MIKYLVAKRDQLRSKLDHLSFTARAAITFRRISAFSNRIGVTGRVRIVEDGTLRLGKMCWFLGGIVPTEIVIKPGAELVLEDEVAINSGVSIECTKHIRVGKRTMVSKMVRIRDSDGMKTAPVVIGERVWIAHGAIIEPGVTIGDDSIISAGSVVVKDVPPSSMAIGNPARSVPLKARGIDHAAAS